MKSMDSHPVPEPESVASSPSRRLSTSEVLARQMELLTQILQQQTVAQQRGSNPSGVPGRPRITAHPPPVYDGKERTNPVKRWLIAMDQYFHVTQLAEELKVDFAANSLRDAAQSWWLTIPKELVNPDGSRRYINWAEFKTTITQHFNPIGSEVAARTRLWNVRQNRSVREYIKEFQDIMVDINDATDAELRDRFTHNLKDHIKREVMQARPGSLAETFYVAELHDQIQWQIHKDASQGYKQGKRPKQQSNQSNESKADGPTPMELGKRQGNNQKSNNPNQEKICYNCGKKGHISKDCWSKKKTTSQKAEGNAAAQS